ncbi:dynein axonemal assembly factor 1 homolog [Lucilia cuprina]|uniref:dynein axonemal assembly factor 1 homolog n=1 Tax=Lucilia cuprina TaxID=7375 RepID=UPI001F06E7F0|nr:dynein axonemal assembly factor 1 homolog [Lucilia cuprina]
MQRNKESKEILGLNRITKKRIMELCKKDKLYQTPELNDVLYLHYQGFECIECLEDYTELKCLWLECNAISEIQGLEKQAKLKCLFLQSNLIRKIENLDYCRELDTINLSQNHIRKIENCGFEILPVLNTLNLSSNYLKDSEALRELENCKNLSVLDLSNNRIDDILVVKIFAKMPELKVLVLQGNPVVSKIPQYRKTLTLECKKLTYLDSRPVFPKDRACAEAWKRGGYEEERKENERWNRRERKKMRDGVNATIQLRNKNRKLEDQISLIPSSDSEDETKNSEKKNRANMEVDIDSMWDEVVEDKHSERSSSSVTSDESKVSVSTQSSESNKEEQETVNKMEDNRLIPESSETNILDSSQCCEGSEEAEETILETVENVEKVEILNELKNILEPEKLTSDTLKSPIKEQNPTDPNRTAAESKLENFSEPPTKRVQLHIEYYNSLEICSGNLKNTSMTNIGEATERQESELKSSVNKLETESATSLNCKDFDYSFESMKNIPQQSSIKEIEEPQINSSNNVFNQDTPITGNIQKFSSKNNHLYVENFEISENSNVSLNDSLMDPSENYQTTIEAIRNVTESNDSPEDSIIQNNETCYRTEDKVDDNYDSLREMEDTMNILNHRSEEQSLLLSNPKKDPKEHLYKLENDQERLEVNKKVRTDFEKLSTNLNDFVEQLDQEQKERQEIFNALYDKNLAPKESSSESSGSEENDHLEEWKLERMIDQWDRGSKLKKDSTEGKSNAEINKNLKETFQSCPTNIKKTDESLKDSLGSVAVKTEKPSSTSSSDKFDYIPMDISLLTRKSNEALDSLERESKELKRLLQQLEDKNDDLFKDINAEMKCEKEKNKPENLEKESKEIGENNSEKQSNEKDDFKTADCMTSKSEIKCEREESMPEENEDLFKELNVEIKCEREECLLEQEGKETDEMGEDNIEKQTYTKENNKAKQEQVQDKQNFVKGEKSEECEREQPQIVPVIVEELIKSLELKQKSYKFPETLQNLEIESSTETKRTQQSVSENLPDFVKTFNQFYKDIETKNQEKKKLPEDKEKQKSEVLKELSKQTHLKQFNNDTLESLDAQLAEMKRVQHDRVRRMVDRVYAQKDRYNDTLELVEGKLMVRHRDTQELRELAQPVMQESSESDADYDTAQSQEEDNDGDSKFEKRLKRKPYKPTTRKSSEDLIIQALIANKSHKASDDSEESNDDDEFYSLDPQDPTNLYKEIDKEFFHKLTLENLKFSQQDENHIVQCARSYEELKHCLSLSKEERGLNEEENDLVEDMIERKCLKLKENTETLHNNQDGTTKEQLWFDKVKSEDQEERNEKELKSSKEAMQLFTYYPNTNTDQQSSEPKFEVSEHMNTTSEYECENLMKTILLRKLAEQKDKLQKENIFKREKPEPNKNDHESILSYERSSEEEKNEIESNIDFESGASNKKTFKCQAKEVLNNDDELGTEEENLTATSEECFTNDNAAGGNSAGVEILECNLEIIGCNDELVDTITVNAEVHF